MHLRILPGLCDVPCHRFWARKVANPAESGDHAIIKHDHDSDGSDNPRRCLCFSSGYHHEKVPSNPTAVKIGLIVTMMIQPMLFVAAASLREAPIAPPTPRRRHAKDAGVARLPAQTSDVAAVQLRTVMLREWKLSSRSLDHCMLHAIVA